MAKDQIKINLRTNDGKVGYRINKFQVIPEDPAGTTGEITVKIFKEPQNLHKFIEESI